MNCVNHSDIENVAFCVKCGHPLCAECVRRVQSSTYCENCLAESLGGESSSSSSSARASDKTVRSVGGNSPEAAFVLGLIPGVGAIYNAEFFKAAIHIVIFVTLITLSDSAGRSGEMMFGFLGFGFYVYMPFEAYFTAKKRKLAREGIDLETPFDRMGQQLGDVKDREFWGGVVLVGLGSLFLLGNFGIISIEQVAKLWPALLIAAGVVLIQRFRRERSE
jgi:hypothetical protein